MLKGINITENVTGYVNSSLSTLSVTFQKHLTMCSMKVYKNYSDTRFDDSNKSPIFQILETTKFGLRKKCLIK